MCVDRSQLLPKARSKVVVVVETRMRIKSGSYAAIAAFFLRLLSLVMILKLNDGSFCKVNQFSSVLCILVSSMVVFYTVRKSKDF